MTETLLKMTGMCKGCRASVRLPAAEVDRILGEYLRDHPQEVLDATAAAARLALCITCDDLHYGTTCRHCGCLVAVRTRLKDAHCSRPAEPRW